MDRRTTSHHLARSTQGGPHATSINHQGPWPMARIYHMSCDIWDLISRRVGDYLPRALCVCVLRLPSPPTRTAFCVSLVEREPMLGHQLHTQANPPADDFTLPRRSQQRCRTKYAPPHAQAPTHKQVSRHEPPLREAWKSCALETDT